MATSGNHAAWLGESLLLHGCMIYFLQHENNFIEKHPCFDTFMKDL
jgi:hypothetical protein